MCDFIYLLSLLTLFVSKNAEDENSTLTGGVFVQRFFETNSVNKLSK